jgi:chorismate dehydratase
METVRIGCVKFLNTLPLVQGLGAWREAELSAAVPAKLIGMLMSGQVDVALCSLIDYARAQEMSGGGDGVRLLPVGMIGCDGPTMTVRVYSAVPPEQITTLHADTDSHSSVVLAQVVLWRRYGVRVRVVDFDARERVEVGSGAERRVTQNEWPQTLLLIGDKVVTDAPPPGMYAHEIDLGEAWKELTGLPFMYATWMCRAAALEDEGSTRRVRTAAAVLDRALRHNTTRADWLVAAEAPARGWPRDVATHYFRDCLRHEVGERERQAAQRFLNEAAELGVCPRAEARWVEIG